MNNIDWISSEGGPLICVEKALASSWKGCDSSSISTEGVASDYERASRVFDYVESLPLARGQALVFGEGPLETATWCSNAGTVFVVRIFASEKYIDLAATMNALDADLFTNPIETLDFSFATAEAIIFDSAEAGSDADDNCLTFFLKPGRFKISTQRYNPDPTSSLILHRFEPAG